MHREPVRSKKLAWRCSPGERSAAPEKDRQGGVSGILFTTSKSVFDRHSSRRIFKYFSCKDGTFLPPAWIFTFLGRADLCAVQRQLSQEVFTNSIQNIIISPLISIHNTEIAQISLISSHLLQATLAEIQPVHISMLSLYTIVKH